jgi:acetyltransferase-like isoleucine patch superfamily enzyme
MFKSFKNKIRNYVISIISQELKNDRERILKHENFILYNNQHFIYGELTMGDNSFIEDSTRLNLNEGTLLKFEGNNYVGRFGEISPNKIIQIGFGTSIQERCFILGEIKIGRYCIISNNVFICSGTHHYSLKPERYIRDQNIFYQSSNTENKDSIEIHDDVWIGHNVIIKPGVIIKKGAIINPFTVVDRNVEMYEIFSNNKINEQFRLTFKVPNYILFSDTRNFPFLYSGFLLDNVSFKEANNFGGVYASKFFSLLIDSKGYEKIVLTLKSCEISELKVTNNVEELVVNNINFTELIFSINHHSKFQKFSIVDVDEGYLPLIFLKEVKLF